VESPKEDALPLSASFLEKRQARGSPKIQGVRQDPISEIPREKKKKKRSRPKSIEKETEGQVPQTRLPTGEGIQEAGNRMEPFEASEGRGG